MARYFRISLEVDNSALYGMGKHAGQRCFSLLCPLHESECCEEKSTNTLPRYFIHLVVIHIEFI